MSSTGVVRVWHFSKGWGVFDSPDTPGGVYADAQSLRLLAVADLNDPLASMGLRPGTEVEFVWSDAADDPLEGLRYEVQQAWPIGVADRRGRYSAVAAGRGVLHHPFGPARVTPAQMI